MYSIYIGPQYILHIEYTFKCILERESISYRELEGITFKRVSHRLKTVTNLSAKCQIFIFSTLFSGLKRHYLVKGIDYNEKSGTQVLLLIPF